MKRRLIICEFHGANHTDNDCCPLCPQVTVQALTEIQVQKPQIIKSIQNSDRDVLTAVLQLYKPVNNLGDIGFDLDPCFSTGKFYEDIEWPITKYDKTPTENYNQVQQNDILNGIPLNDKSVNSVVFDPPFMFGTHGQTKNNIMTKRFTMFDSWNELETMYKTSLREFYRVLRKGGIVAFKCQDYTDSQTTLTHCYVHNWALEVGFKVEDLFIMAFKGGRVWNSNLKQKHARKYHSYWLILKK